MSPGCRRVRNSPARGSRTGRPFGNFRTRESGAPGGWPIAPVASRGGRALAYPARVVDLATVARHPVDAAGAAEVPLFLFPGPEDAFPRWHCASNDRSDTR